MINEKADDFNKEEVFTKFWSNIETSLNTFQYTKIADFNNIKTDKVDIAHFECYIDGFMNAFDVKNDKQKIIAKACEWLQDYNEKSKLKQNCAV